MESLFQISYEVFVFIIAEITFKICVRILLDFIALFSSLKKI